MRGATNRNAATCSTSTRTAVRISDLGATKANRIGRTIALNSAMKTIARIPAHTLSTVMPGRMAAVTASAIIETISVMTRRLNSANGPPCQFHRMWIWVRRISIGPLKVGLPRCTAGSA